MSGGSYDYLCLKDAIELISDQENLKRMIDRLSQTPNCQQAATDSQTLLCIIEQFEEDVQEYVKELAHLWRAVEWVDSGDWREEEIEIAALSYSSPDLP